MFLKHRIPGRNNILTLSHDVVAAFVCLYMAFAIRFGSLNWETFNHPYFFKFLALGGTIQVLVFLIAGLHRGIWRFTSAEDLSLVIKTALVAVLSSSLLLFLSFRLDYVPRSIFITDWLLLVVTLGGSRFFYRMLKNKTRYTAHGKKAILVGAGSAGEMLIREYRAQNESPSHEIACIVDDAQRKQGGTVRGIPILGTTEDIPELANQFNAEVVYIAIPSATSEQMRRIFNICKSANLSARTLPRIIDLINGNVSLNQLREINLDDLLGRETIKLDTQQIGHQIEGQVVLVTGAGGSIGSELCRQILRFNPSKLVAVDNSEFNLYKIEGELRNAGYDEVLQTCVADVRNQQKMEFLFANTRPSIVYHAAAYKHVPMMESNPVEAIQTNSWGTYVVAQTAVKHGCSRFVLVSTDKAVNPTNVMGTSKRIAEMVCQKLQEQKRTQFITVRFGNVLGSSGSVIPKFREQIQKGGPLTVTHPEITRFFMSVEEACQLVLQAGSLGNGGELFVLDMGQPVKILDLAKDLITLSGLRPYEDVQIEFSGLRPGEKLYEELLSDKETTLPTSHPLVRVAMARAPAFDFEQKFQALIQLNDQVPANMIRQQLKVLVEEYQPKDYPQVQAGASTNKVQLH